MKISMYNNNNLQLEGRVANVKEYARDKAANIVLAIEAGKGKDGIPKEAQFIQLKSFVPASYNNMRKGMKVRVYGHISTSRYEKGGQMVYSTDLVADFVRFLETRKQAEGREACKYNERMEDYYAM